MKAQEAEKQLNNLFETVAVDVKIKERRASELKKPYLSLIKEGKERWSRT